jgi:NHL repeat
MRASPANKRQAWLAGLAVIFAGALLLSIPPTASGFGFVTKWRIRGSPSVAARGRAVYTTTGNAHSQWIQKYSTRGALITQWELPDNHGKAMHAAGVATDRAGHVYTVASTHDWKTNKILKYTDRGRLLDSWVAGTGSVIQGIAADAAGHVYVPVTAENRIDKYSSSGRLLLGFESPGPRQLATDERGNIYVAGNVGVSVYRSDGAPIGIWASKGAPLAPSTETGGLEVPTGIAVDTAGHILVADAGKHELDVKIYTSKGTYLGQIGGPGRGNGRFRYSPNSVAVDARGDVYVVSLRTIQKFGEPTSAFSLGGAKLNRRTGVARLVANVPGVGKLTVEGRGIRRARRRANVAGDASVPVTPNRATTRRLKRSGHATIRVQVTYTPTTAGNAHPATRSTSVTLIRTR